MNIIQKENMSLMQREDGFVNATALCKSAGKELGGYLRNDTTKAFLDELSGSMQICMGDLVIKLNNVPNSEKGTYIHPKVAIHLAQWLSPKFAVFVSNIIFDFMNNSQVQIERDPFEDIITSDPLNFSPFTRKWAELMIKYYGSLSTPMHIAKLVYENSLGDGASLMLSKFAKIRKQPLYNFLTDKGRELVGTYIKTILDQSENCKSVREFETLFYTLRLGQSL